jgi:hypothetical protein
MSKSNKNLSALLQTFRSLRYIVLLTTPNLTFIDKQARLLLHMVFVVTDKVSPDLKDSYRKIMPFFVHSPPIWAADGKPSYRFAVWGIDDNAVQIAAFMIPKPPEEFIKLYEIKKREFQQKLYAKLRNDYSDGFSDKPQPKSTFGQYQYIDLNDKNSNE